MWRVFLSGSSVLLCISVTTGFFNTETQSNTEVYREQQFDPAAFYKSNCEECHGSSAQKRFNPDSSEGQMIDAILNGAKAEGTKDMPAFSAKGIDEIKAKALINHMKSIRE